MLRLLALAPALVVACANPSEGLRATPDGSGPTVLIDWDAKPLPDLPLPNDLATRVDPTSPTGLRLNINVDDATTELEARTRRKFNEMTGFGIYGTISVAFEAPLDLAPIYAAHTAQFVNDFEDDLFYVIDVTPGSPTYLQPVELDVGNGRFPQDVARPSAYFPNDVMFDQPSIMFDTRDEDLDGDGELDWGEDVDNDGYLDVPNVYGGAHPRDDLLSWYEKLTNTLMFRPVVPMREETTYAVVLTNRLVGEDGNPVRSPWPYVNHTRQTDALEPLHMALPGLGLSVEDVAYAWTFTTGRITGDMVDLRRALDGEGPYAWVAEQFPPAILDADIVNDGAQGAPSDYELPLSVLVPILALGGLTDEAGAQLLADGYAFGDRMVGGHFRTPNLMADKDDGGFDEVDEWWQLDPMTGEIPHIAENHVAFTCLLPKRAAGDTSPVDIAFYGHGYGSSRAEGILFSWVFMRLGMAACLFDYPSHGADLSPEDIESLGGILEAAGLQPMLDHILDSRYVDVDNDGEMDSGAHQWTADSFHTRDQVRQSVLDWMWFVRALSECGTGTMDLGGEQVVSCDWNNDGLPDLGGPGAEIMLAGGSLGGIVDGVAAAVMPEVKAHVPVVSGAGLLDISTRAPTGGAVEAMHGKVMTPLILGRPGSDGSLRITQYVNSFMRMRELTIATLPEVPVGGRVVVTNLMNDEVREGYIPQDGAFRISVPADAADYYEKRVLTGMPLEGPARGDTTVYSVPGNDGLGDLLVITVYDAQGNKVAELDTFEVDGTFEGVTYPAGSPLVAAASGMGRVRAAPETRRLVQTVAISLEPGDPVAYAPHYMLEPFELLGGQPTNVLLCPHPGDMVVAVNASISHARAAGFIERHIPDARYGMTQDEYLVDRRVVHGLEEFGPYTCADGRPCLFDPDDLDNGTDDFGAPSDDPPLRITVESEAGISGLRMHYISPSGSHGINMPDSSVGFDHSTHFLNQMALYMSTQGTVLSDDPCLEDGSCDWIPTEVPE